MVPNLELMAHSLVLQLSHPPWATFNWLVTGDTSRKIHSSKRRRPWRRPWRRTWRRLGWGKSTWSANQMAPAPTPIEMEGPLGPFLLESIDFPLSVIKIPSRRELLIAPEHIFQAGSCAWDLRRRLMPPLESRQSFSPLLFCCLLFWLPS
jgi:hypothetical protein